MGHMPESVLGALARLELALHEWEPMPEDVSTRLEALRASLQRWPNGAQLTVLAPSHGRWVRTAGGIHIDLSRRRALRRLVGALIDARIHRPGQPLKSDELISAGWPDERLVGEVSLNRLYVALTRLRQLGLMDILVSASDGWLISPAVRVERDEVIDEPTPETQSSESSESRQTDSPRRDSEIRALAFHPDDELLINTGT
jgi:hypothetical protein